MDHQVGFRMAEPCDVAGIVALVNSFATEQVMLPRTPKSVALGIHDFVVASDTHGQVVACGALKEYSPSLAEVASLAVAREAHGQGLGRAIVERLETLARRRGIAELFALTLTPGFFESTGYEIVERARYSLSCLERSALSQLSPLSKRSAEQSSVPKRSGNSRRICWQTSRGV